MLCAESTSTEAMAMFQITTRPRLRPEIFSDCWNYPCIRVTHTQTNGCCHWKRRPESCAETTQDNLRNLLCFFLVVSKPIPVYIISYIVIVYLTYIYIYIYLMSSRKGMSRVVSSIWKKHTGDLLSGSAFSPSTQRVEVGKGRQLHISLGFLKKKCNRCCKSRVK